jgi:hypothetical protein
MNNLRGKKCKGFKFDKKDGYYYDMDEHIGEVGEITYIDDLFAGIRFEKNTWSYPLNEIEKHLVHEENIIPELGEGVLMEVSNHKDFKPSYEDMVLGIYKGSFLTMDEEDWWIWKYAKPIKQKVTLTKQEIADKFGYNINQLIIEK